MPPIKGLAEAKPLDNVSALALTKTPARLIVIGAPHGAYAGLRPSQPVVDIWDLYGNGVAV